MDTRLSGRIIVAALILACSGATAAYAQGPTLPRSPSQAEPILPQGILELAPSAVEALLLPGGDTVFVQASPDANHVALWDSGRKLSGVLGVSLQPGEQLPDPESGKPLLCVHGGEVCVLFVSRDGPYIALGVVYKHQARA